MRLNECASLYKKSKYFSQNLEYRSPEYRHRGLGCIIGHNTFKFASPDIALNNGDPSVLVRDRNVPAGGVDSVVTGVFAPFEINVSALGKYMRQ